ncbi:MAG: ABC transporter ATP-binding protein, partial [Geminicoccaceae bacterium]
MLMLDRTLDLSRDSRAGTSDLVSNPLLPFETRDLRLKIDGKSLINGIDLRVAAANFTVIMGQNGAGKS